MEAWLAANTQLSAECAEQKTGHGSLGLTFDEKGIRLAEDGTGGDCDLEYFLPWQVAKPMLSAKGKAALPSLQVK